MQSCTNTILVLSSYPVTFNLLYVFVGFLSKEIEKAELRMQEPQDSPDAPHPQEMIDLEVEYLHVHESQGIVWNVGVIGWLLV